MAKHKPQPVEYVLKALQEFLRLQAAGGLLLMGAAALAILLANSPLGGVYATLIDTPVEVRFGTLEIAKPLLLWVNDGLMAVFFLLVGLELKREILEGELSDRRNVVLPLLGAVGGMAVPAGIYLLLNWGDAAAMRGWAIPAATDIAFALGVLALLGPRVPTGLRLFLASLAIFDDVGAIVIIALFYTSEISTFALSVSGGCAVALFLLNRYGVVSRSVYGIVGAALWVAMLKSGIHATLAGVVLALAIPLRSQREPDRSPLKELEHDLHAAVAFLILPLFAFCNSGLDLRGVGWAQLTHGVPLGIALGLLVGKPVGVFALSWLGIKAGVAELPRGASWASLFGVSALCGIGFTMSLFIGALAFGEAGAGPLFDERLGIILGSLVSGVLGSLILVGSLGRGRV